MDRPPRGPVPALLCLSAAATLGAWLDGLFPLPGERGWLLPVAALGLLAAGSLSALGRSAAWPKLLLLYVSTSLGVTACDAAFRTLLPERFYYREHERFLRPMPGYEELLRYQPGVSSVSRSLGDLAAMMGERSRAVPRRVSFGTDALGFRNEPEQWREPFDVLILGDSFVFGPGTTQEAIWPQVLRRDHRVPNYSLAMPGGPWTHLLDTKLFLPRLRPRPGATLLLCLFEGNDLDDGYSPVLEPEGLRPSGPWADALRRLRYFQGRNLVWKALSGGRGLPSKPLVWPTLLGGRTPALFFGLYGAAAARGPEAVAAHPNAALLTKALDEFRGVSAARGLPLKVVLFPCKEQAYAWGLAGTPFVRLAGRQSGFSRWLEAYCGRSRVPYLDLRAAFEAEAKASFERDGTLLWWPDDTHLNERGHAFAAERIALFLRESARAPRR